MKKRDGFGCVKTLVAFFCMLFFEVLPYTTLAPSVNGKTSKKSVQKRDVFWCVYALKVFKGLDTPKTAASFLHDFP